MSNEYIYIFFHSPRTGGTYFTNCIPHYLDRENNGFLAHYHYVQHHSNWEYQRNDVPLLCFRTTEQHKELKIITGHSTFCNSGNWLKVRKTPRHIMFVRNPIERILSSFNYRREKGILSQDPMTFSTMMPSMNENAYRQKKQAEDYETLYEYYQDCHADQNLQCKWIVKNFLKRGDGNNWFPHHVYVFGPDTGSNDENIDPLAWQDWFWDPPDGTHWFNIASSFIDKIWWIGLTENLDQDIKDFCEYSNIEYTETVEKNESGLSSKKYWTMEDVVNQPDYDKLVAAEEHDFKLYNLVKKLRRPF